MGILKGKFTLFLIFCISIFVLIILKFAPPPEPCSSTKIKNRSTFPRATWKSITMSARGYWEGHGLAEYHAWHYGPKLADRLLKFFKNENATSVVDLGGGAGLHVQHFMQNGIFASCYDGSSDAQDVSQGLCATMDLTKPMQLSRYDWVLSLSVGRQIPFMLEDVFMKNIDDLNSRGVVMFWGDGRAVQSPKNKKNNTQVTSLFAKFGYTNDEVAGKAVRGNKVTEVNYSIQVFRRNVEVGNVIMSLVNPGNYPVKRQSSLKDLVPSLAPSDKELRVCGDCLNIGVTSCGLEKMEEALTMIKSAVIFSQHTKLRALAFVDPESHDQFSEKMQQLQHDSKQINPNFQYEILPINFPEDIEGMASWKQIFKPCSLQRLFLPDILPSVDALIYMDADSLFLSNVTDFWNHFFTMAPKNFIGVTQITELQVRSWFQKHKFPHYGQRGVNTGISMMNLTRMRESEFLKLITKVRKHYEHLRPKETGDQFMQNILYSFEPDFVSLIPCDWNLRPVHCRCYEAKDCACNSALENGVAVIHGTKNAFSEEERLPFYRNIYESFRTYNFTSDNVDSLRKQLMGKFKLEKVMKKNKPQNSTCFFKDSSTLYKRMETYALNLREL